MNLSDDIKNIKGIGEKTASLFAKASVFCIGDLLRYYPRNYIKLPSITTINLLVPGSTNAIHVKVSSSVSMFSKNGKTIISFNVSDRTGTVKVYYFNAPYLKNSFRLGQEIVLYGVFSKDRKGFSNPKTTTKANYEQISQNLIPVYPLIKGLTSAKIRDSIKTAFSELTTASIKDYLSDDLLNKYSLISIYDALYKMHFSETLDEINVARKRIAFDEFFVFLYKMKKLKGEDRSLKTSIVIEDNQKCRDFISKLPYELTKGQQDAVNAVIENIGSGLLMNRLLQGDVGCGKTIVSIIACYQAILSGYQAAIMAPTVVLASQHYEDIVKFNEQYELGIKPVLLTGSMKAAERREALKLIASGEGNLIIGTHALFSDNVVYHNLGLTVCDEQHRFGVKQRLSLIQKGDEVHQLVMSATPIPRTLGLILYGDLDITTILEKPAMRLPLKNAVVGPEFRPKSYKFIQEQIEQGKQAYIICSMVEESEEENLKAVTTYIDEIRPHFPETTRMAILHGKMKDSEKDKIMLSYKAHEIDILISTTVIEVGVNVPNATVMVIENADRFGLAQLHQLRGRVGRGKDQSYVIYITENKSDKNMERLGLLAKTNDGFEIASEDLKLRGPGDFFGYKQSGLPGFKIADIYTDADMLQKAKEMLTDNVVNVELIINTDSIQYYFNSFDKDYLCL